MSDVEIYRDFSDLIPRIAREGEEPCTWPELIGDFERRLSKRGQG